MLDILGYPFFQQALLLGLLSSIACGIVGSFVVVKRLSGIAGSIAHCAFGGVGIGVLLGFNPLLGALGFGLGCTLLLAFIRLNYKQREDVLLSAVWAVGMSVGLICVSFAGGMGNDVTGYLFGNVLLTTPADLWFLALLDGVIVGTVVLLFNGFKAVTFDEDYAQVSNLAYKRLYVTLLVLISLTTVVLLRLVGGVLVIALLSFPAATALNLSRRLSLVMALAIAAGCIAMAIGLFTSYAFNLPSGPAIVLASALLYGLSLVRRG